MSLEKFLLEWSHPTLLHNREFNKKLLYKNAVFLDKPRVSRIKEYEAFYIIIGNFKFETISCKDRNIQ